MSEERRFFNELNINHRVAPMEQQRRQDASWVSELDVTDEQGGEISIRLCVRIRKSEEKKMEEEGAREKIIRLQIIKKKNA